MTEASTPPRSVTWDGKNLAAIQTLTALLPRTEGRPAAEVDADWNLTVAGLPVMIGATVTVTGIVRVSPPRARRRQRDSITPKEKSMRDDEEITPAGVIVQGFRWLPVLIIGSVVLLGLGLVLSLFVYHVGGVFQKAGIQRTYTNTVTSQAYQDSLLAQMQQHLTNITEPGGLAATRTSLPASSPEQQVVRSQELNELNQFCAESVRFVPQTEGPAGQQLETVITANCLAGVPVTSPPLAPPAP